MRVLILTLMMSFLSQGAFGAAKRSLASYIEVLHRQVLFESLDTLIRKGSQYLEIKEVMEKIKEAMPYEGNLDLGYTLLNCAMMYNCSLEVVKFLHEKKNEIINQQKITNGQTPLMHASLHNQPELLEVLLELDPSHEHVRNNTQEGFTALMYASMRGHSSIVEKLIEADPESDHIGMKSSDGFTALDYAKDNNRVRVIGLLEKSQGNKRRKGGESPTLELLGELAGILKSYSSGKEGE